MLVLQGVLRAGAQLPLETPNLSTWETDGIVNSIAYVENTIFIGGSFSRVRPALGYGVPLEIEGGQPVSTFPPVNGQVYAAISDGVGGWYIGGEFTHVGGHRRNGIAHILPSGAVNPDWAPDASKSDDQNDLTQLVVTVAFSDSTVYVGGGFTNIGGESRNHIAAIDAITGKATAWNPNADGIVLSLKVFGSTVFAGGGFASIGGTAIGNLAAVDAVTGQTNIWSPGADDIVRALEISGSTVYVGGSFTNLGGQGRNHIAAIDAADGLVLDWDPNADDLVFALESHGGTVYAGGFFSTIGGKSRHRIAAISATTGNVSDWQPDANGRVLALEVSGSRILAGGFFESIGGQSRKNLAALDIVTGEATDWIADTEAFVRTLAVFDDFVYVGGDLLTIGGKERNNLAAINALTGIPTDWNPNVEGEVLALSASEKTLYVGGDFTRVRAEERNFLAAIDVATGNLTDWAPFIDNRVRALAASASTVYVGGDFKYAGGQVRPRLAALDTDEGRATIFRPELVGESVFELAILGETILVGGAFDSVGGRTRENLAQVDAITGVPTDWNPTALRAIDVMGITDTTLYVGGSRTFGQYDLSTLEGESGGHRGASFTVPNAFLNRVEAMAVSGSMLFIGGRYSDQDDRGIRQNISALTLSTGNTSAWNPRVAGSFGVSEGTVHAMAVLNSTLFIGGDFSTIDGYPRQGFAQFEIPRKQIEVFPSSPDFGASRVDRTKSLRLTITNVTQSEVLIDGMELFGLGYSDHTNPFREIRVFSQFDLEGVSGEFSLAPGESRALTVFFSPTQTTMQLASLVIESTGPNGTVLDELFLTGEGVNLLAAPRQWIFYR